MHMETVGVKGLTHLGMRWWCGKIGQGGVWIGTDWGREDRDMVMRGQTLLWYNVVDIVNRIQSDCWFAVVWLPLQECRGESVLHGSAAVSDKVCGIMQRCQCTDRQSSVRWHHHYLYLTWTTSPAVSSVRTGRRWDDVSVV